MRLYIYSCSHFEETFENAQWRKIKQMQPMRLCLFSGRQFEDTFENAQNPKKTIDNVIKSIKCNQCVFASSQVGDLRRYLMTHSATVTVEKSQTNATNVTLHPFIQVL